MDEVKLILVEPERKLAMGEKQTWHAPVITRMDIRKTMDFCGSQEDLLGGWKGD
mgnify:CR=1 FL=1